MKPLAGHRVAALGGTAQRPLARYLASLGAEIVGRRRRRLVRARRRSSWMRAADGPLPADVIHVSVTTFGSWRPAQPLAGRRIRRLGHGRRPARHRRTRPAAGQGGARRLHLPRRHGRRRRRDGRAFRARHARPGPACRRVDPAGRLQPQRQRHPRLAVRPAQAGRAPAAALAYGQATDPRDLAARRRLVLPFADDRPARRARPTRRCRTGWTRPA